MEEANFAEHSVFTSCVFSCKYGILDDELALIGEQKCVASLSQLKALLGHTCREDQCCGKISRTETLVTGNLYLQYLYSIFNSKKINAYVFY